jgi:hypothetical protein
MGWRFRGVQRGVQHHGGAAVQQRPAGFVVQFEAVHRLALVAGQVLDLHDQRTGHVVQPRATCSRTPRALARKPGRPSTPGLGVERPVQGHGLGRVFDAHRRQQAVGLRSGWSAAWWLLARQVMRSGVQSSTASSRHMRPWCGISVAISRGAGGQGSWGVDLDRQRRAGQAFEHQRRRRGAGQRLQQRQRTRGRDLPAQRLQAGVGAGAWMAASPASATRSRRPPCGTSTSADATQSATGRTPCSGSG